MPNVMCSHKILNLDNSSKNTIFLIPNSTLDEFFSDTIPLTFLNHEYIDRPKLSEQKTHLSL